MTENTQPTPTDESQSEDSPAKAIADVSVDLSTDDMETSEPDTDVESVDAELVAQEDHEQASEEPDQGEQNRAVPDPNAADQDDDFETEFGIGEDELREQAQTEAKRILQNTDSDDPSEMIEEASEHLSQQHSSIIQQFKQTQQRAERLREQRNGLVDTVERLREIADDEDRLVIQTMAGGIAESLPADERRKVADDYDERCGELNAQADQLDDRTQALKRSLKKIEFAHQELKNPQGILSDVIAGSIADL